MIADWISRGSTSASELIMGGGMLICLPCIPHVIENSWQPLYDLSHSGNGLLGSYVTCFAKTLHLHTTDFSDLVTCNSKSIKAITIKFLHNVKQ